MASHIARRRFLATLGGAAAWPLAARAQQPGKIPRIGIIDDSLHWNAFRRGLRDLGYLEGQNIVLRLQILKEAIPTVSRVAFLWNPDNASNVLQFEEIQAAAPTLGVTVISVSVLSLIHI